jgi:hypothetical protein
MLHFLAARITTFALSAATAAACRDNWCIEGSRRHPNPFNAKFGIRCVEGQVCPIDYSWLTTRPKGHYVNTGAHTYLQSLAGGILTVGLVICGVVFLVGIAGWASARTGNGFGDKDQSFWAGRAGLALFAAALISALWAAFTWGVSSIGPSAWKF